MKLTLDAKKLRIILLVVMLILVVGTVAAFIFARKELQSFATSISQMEADAASVDSNIAALKQLEGTIDEVRDVKSKADSIAVPASEYPVAVIANINKIASKAGVTIASISYGDTSADSNAANPVPPSSTGVTAPPATTSPSGMTKKTVNVALESPVDYDALMNFIKGIETDDMFMYITKVSLAKSSDNAVNTQPFTIEVYTK